MPARHHVGAEAPGPVTPTSENAGVEPGASRGNGEGDSPDSASGTAGRKQISAHAEIAQALARQGAALEDVEGLLAAIHIAADAQEPDALELIAHLAVTARGLVADARAIVEGVAP